jgi:hypothetical protein
MVSTGGKGRFAQAPGFPVTAIAAEEVNTEF